MSAFQEATEMSIKTTRNLEKAGMPRPQAEGVVRAVAEMITLATENLVTKDYAEQNLVSKEYAGKYLATKKDLAELEARMDARLARLETRMMRMQLWTVGLLTGVITIFEFLG